MVKYSNARADSPCIKACMAVFLRTMYCKPLTLTLLLRALPAQASLSFSEVKEKVLTPFTTVAKLMPGTCMCAVCVCDGSVPR
jgi:hypothetical protein